VNTSTTVGFHRHLHRSRGFSRSTKFQNVLVTITATSNADKKKTGSSTLVSIPASASPLRPQPPLLGTVETQQFFAKDSTA